MGILVLNTPAAQVTTTVPVNKDVQANVFQVARTDTASRLALELPADATILEVRRCASTASNAGTTAGVTVTVTNNSGTVSSGTDDVKTNGAAAGSITMSGLPNAEPRPLTGDLQITVQYAETGVASSAGGPWNYVVYYVR